MYFTDEKVNLNYLETKNIPEIKKQMDDIKEKKNEANDKGKNDKVKNDKGKNDKGKNDVKDLEDLEK